VRFPQVCVVGGGGYVGTLLTRSLLDASYRVTVFDAFWFGDRLGEHPALSKITDDIRDTARVSSAMAGHEAVILLACISNDPMADLDPAFTKEVNLDAIQRLILAAKALGVARLVYASSASVYGMQDVERVTEDTPLKPITLYSTYKMEVEAFLQGQTTDGFTSVAVRSSTVCGYSPRMRLDLLLNLFCYLALTRGSIAIEGGQQIRPLIHIQDLVAFYRLMLEVEATKIRGEAFNVSSGNFTVLQVAEMVRAQTGCQLTYSSVVDGRSYPADSEKAARVLGFRTRRTIHDAMIEVCDAIRDGRICTDDSTNFNLRRYKELHAAS